MNANSDEKGRVAGNHANILQCIKAESTPVARCLCSAVVVVNLPLKASCLFTDNTLHQCFGIVIVCSQNKRFVLHVLFFTLLIKISKKDLLRYFNLNYIRNKM